MVDQAEAVSAVCASLLQIRVQSSDNRLLLLFGSVSVRRRGSQKRKKAYSVDDITSLEVFLSDENFLVSLVLYGGIEGFGREIIVVA